MNSSSDHRTALEAALLELDSAWTLLAGVRLGATGADYLLLHPQHGAALLDLVPGRHDGVRALRIFLDEQDFARFFAGTVPIVHLTLEPGAEGELRRRLGVAFAACEPATFANPEWTAALAALIAAEQSRGAWLGAPTPSVETAQPDAAEAHFAASSPRAAQQRAPAVQPEDEAPDDPPPPARDLAPRMPRWQTVAAFASLAAFAMLYLALPGETPNAPPAAVEIAIAPAAPHEASGSSMPPPSIAGAQQPLADIPETPLPPVAPLPPAPAALAPVPPHAAAETPVTVAAIPPAPAASPPAKAPAPPPAAPAFTQPRVDASSMPLPAVAEAAPPAKVAALPPPRVKAKEATARKAPPHVAEAPAPADELAVNALPPPPSPRPDPPPEARPVQPVSDLIHHNCRVYTSRVTVLGAPAEVRGFACQAPDGSWEIMSEAPAAAQ